MPTADAAQDQGARRNRRRQTGESGEPWTGKVVIELGDDRNRNIMFGPLQESLRGRWEKSNLLADEVTVKTEHIPTIPGTRIELDGAKKQARIYDPLAEPKNSKVLSQARKAYQILFNKDGRPFDERIFDLKSPSKIKTWLYWMRRLVEGTPIVEDHRTSRNSGGPQARVIEGDLPTFAEIAAMPGKTEMELYNQSHNKGRWREDRNDQPVAEEEGAE